MKKYQFYEFNSASQEIKDASNNKITITGRHELMKLKGWYFEQYKIQEMGDDVNE